MNTAVMLFIKGFGQGALAAASAFAVLVICTAAVFLTLLCYAPLKRLRR